MRKKADYLSQGIRFNAPQSGTEQSDAQSIPLAQDDLMALEEQVSAYEADYSASQGASSATIPWDHDHSKRAFKPICNNLDGVIANLLSRHPDYAEDPIDTLTTFWERQMPSDVTKFAKPVRFSEGLLTIKVANSVKLFEIKRIHRMRIQSIFTQKPIQGIVVKAVTFCL